MITKWYVPEPNSPAALALRNRFNPPSALTHVHRTELQNAWQLKVYRAVSVRLAREHTAALGTRSLDVLHVAAALALRERHFVTADDRQAKLAAAVGLRVTKL